ncbi:hypothetical protein [Pseudobacteriovorax antillogorgiicola]|uniref:Uncharacterized protein n=2 Tax=Pseudobacteriovorax antillogorgiicola TaxID=1513793 RepID=A0A1Y6CKV9_9BACT|nr:hypothetical protein [Pseudobacteriovorax antillogorgiicola]TCS46199.1 hypothetical protein EDD56_125100 [Pseudobacteriovorax antillogorgiicola]SMF70525.1 hypothetical protein SAMN06296036_125100 [Pseudobacteriovorax antillogorgiicola]
MFNILSNEAGNATTSTLLLSGALLGGFHAVDLDVTTQSVMRQAESQQIGIDGKQDIISASAILKSIVCRESSLSTPKYPLSDDDLEIVLEIPKSSQDFDRIFEGREGSRETRTVRFAHLGSDSNHMIFSSVTELNDSIIKQNLRIDCSPSDTVIPEDILASHDILFNEVYLGLGYEDWFDYDHNDLAFCFEGKFAADRTTGVITSMVDQKVDTKISKRSSSNSIVVKLHRKVGDKFKLDQTIQGLKRGHLSNETLSFKKGEQFLLTFSSNIIQKSGPQNLTGKRVRVEADNCRTSGR